MLSGERYISPNQYMFAYAQIARLGQIGKTDRDIDHLDPDLPLCDVGQDLYRSYPGNMP